MKSTVLVGTLAASLVSTLHADVFVLGASWRERSITAPDGVLERKMRNAAAPRAYVIMENATAPALNGAFIEYNNDRTTGKTYTVTNNFKGFTADMVEDAQGSSQRLFGHIFTPVQVADVPNAMMPFSGSVHGSFKPRRLTFDKMVFQSGDSTAIAGPNLVRPGTVFRSLVSGSGSNFEVESTTLTGAVNELTARLDAAGYIRQAVAPVITTEPAANVPRAGFVTAELSVGLQADVFPTPTYAWFKEAGAPGPVGDTLVGTAATFTVPAGDPGTGTYYVVVSTSAGSDTSANSVVPAPSFKQMGPLTALPASVVLAQGASQVLNPGVNADAWPRPTYRWQRLNGTSGAGTFLDVSAGDGGNLPTFTVVGETGNTIRGTGARYQVIVSQAAPANPATLTSTTATVTQAAP